MDIIIKIADNFNREHLHEHPDSYDKIISAAKSKIYEIDNHLDKIKFLNALLDGNRNAYEKHKLKCKVPPTEICPENFTYESITYFLGQELTRLGVQFNEDTFTMDEKESTDSKLDTILKDIQELKMGHQIIYDDLTKELEELKELYFLGKKKWQQLFVGKSVEMVTSGIISETVSKQIIESIKPTLNNLLG